jgi:cytochrome bd ubiquinol oxidase subunit II
VWSSWLNPTSITVGALGVITGAYLAAVFMAGDSVRAKVPELAKAFRTRALASGVVAGVLAIGALPILSSDAPDLYAGLDHGAGLACVVASGVFGVATLALVAGWRFEAARVTAAGAVVAVLAGWAIAQSPYLLPGHLTLDQAAAGSSTLTAFLVSFAIGAVVLVPSLVYLYRLVLKGTLDQDYEPLHQRFTAVPEDPE